MPTFCRHNRFLDRCPICGRELAGASATSGASSAATPSRGKSAARARARAGGASRGGRRREEGVRVHREGRAADDGYRCQLVPGLHASADARRLAEEMAFSCGRLQALAVQPPGLYGEIRALAGHDLERATWACFLTAYLCPLEGEEPFAGIRAALAAPPDAPGALVDVPLGPRTCHDPARGAGTLRAYDQWVARGPAAEDATTMAAKRVFGIGDHLLPERRAAALAQAAAVPIETLDLALANWASSEPATLGFSREVADAGALERAREALGL